MPSPEPEFGRCNTCGADLTTEGQARRQNFDEMTRDRTAGQLHSLRADLRAVVENAKTADVAAIRHQLVGLLPECRAMDSELVERLRASKMDHLIERHAERLKAAWAEYGYPGA